MPVSATLGHESLTMPIDSWQSLAPGDAARLDALRRRFQQGRSAMVGYPVNQVFDYRELFEFLEFAGNNIGDPFDARGSGLDTQQFEREVIQDLAQLLNLPAQETWGYVTSGGTEGNLYSIDLARERYPDGIVYHSDESHYSIAKALRVTRTPCVVIATDEWGEMDAEDLKSAVARNPSRPAIVVANIGTTIKGAIDDVPRIRAALASVGVVESFIHCDAALAGLMLPFVEDVAALDFAEDADSIAISGHKLIGMPLPCGVVLTRRRHAALVAKDVPYLKTRDATMSGSRSALAPLMLWYAMKRLGSAGFEQMVARCLELADFAVEAFAAHGIPAWRNPHSIAIVFPCPSDTVLRRWHMASRDDVAQIVTLPHVTEETITHLAQDIARSAEHNQNGLHSLKPTIHR